MVGINQDVEMPRRATGQARVPCSPLPILLGVAWKFAQGTWKKLQSFPQFPLYSHAVLAYGKGAHLEWVAPRPTASASPTVLLKMQNLRLLLLLLPAESGTLGWDTPFYVFMRSLGDLRTTTSEPQRSDS